MVLLVCHYRSERLQRCLDFIALQEVISCQCTFSFGKRRKSEGASLTLCWGENTLHVRKKILIRACNFLQSKFSHCSLFVTHWHRLFTLHHFHCRNSETSNSSAVELQPKVQEKSNWMVAVLFILYVTLFLRKMTEALLFQHDIVC